MIVMQPVLEIYTPGGFDLWPVAEIEPFGFLPLSGALSPAEVGTAVMRIADCNDSDLDRNDSDPDGDRPPHPSDAQASFLHGLPAGLLRRTGGLARLAHVRPGRKPARIRPRPRVAGRGAFR
ncbi:hypothetical protein [Streptomyces gardneri]|uniref:hypothetical protein n=1 Tax=Streptomyces gardneri TaxID=66892 RepID=UPI0036CBCC2A